MKLARLAAAALPFFVPLLFGLAHLSIAFAQVSGPAFPPPGGVTFSATGDLPGNPGGRLFTFAGFDSSAFGDLYWGANSANLPRSGLNGVAHAMSFTGGIGTPTAIWTGTTPYTNPTTLVPQVAQTLLQITLSPGFTWIASSSVLGLDPGPGTGIGAVVDTNGMNFSANIQFLANVGFGMQAINTIPQFPGTLTQTSFAGGFYSTDALAAIPEPETYAMLLAGLGLLGFGARRRRKQ